MKYFVYLHYVVKDIDYVENYSILSNIYFELYFYMKISVELHLYKLLIYIFVTQKIVR